MGGQSKNCVVEARTNRKISPRTAGRAVEVRRSRRSEISAPIPIHVACLQFFVLLSSFTFNSIIDIFYLYMLEFVPPILRVV